MSFSLKKTALKGGAIVLFGFGSSQVIRLAGNLILTRLLYPEIFGAMALVNVVITGIKLFSDIGIRGGLITNDNSDCPSIYNTAWTMQVLRGLFIFLFIAAMSVPVERFYGIEGMAAFLTIAGLSALVEGFNSTSMIAIEKKLSYSKTITIELGTQIIVMLVMILLSWKYRSIWVLVGCSVLQSTIFMSATHLYLSGHKNRFHWDSAAFRQIFNYGKWVMVSTAAGFLTMEADRLVIGKYFSTGLLGVYSIAIVISTVFSKATGVASTRLLFPLYRRVFDEKGGDAGPHISKVHMMVLLAGIAIYLPLVFWGGYLIEFLYDDRYIDAAWMLSILAVAGITKMLVISLRPMLLAKGDSFSMMKSQCIECVIYLCLLFFGVEHYGLIGVFFALIFAPLLSYPFLYMYVSRYGYRGALVDSAIIVFSFLCIVAYWWQFNEVVVGQLNAAFNL